MEGHLMQQKRKGYIMQQKDHVVPCYPQVIYPTLMVLSGLRHLLHLHLALLLPLPRLYPHYRES
jgi:hypothetical protein